MVAKAKKPGKAKNKSNRAKTGGLVETQRTIVGEAADTQSPANIPLEYVLPPDVPVFYADNVNVINSESEFVISFLQTQHPLIKNEEDWNNIKSVQAKCVARIVISPMKMQAIVGVLVGNFQGYYNKFIRPIHSEGANVASDTETANDRQ